MDEFFTIGVQTQGGFPVSADLQRTRRPRKSEKCESCRKDKQRCDFESGHSQCNRCILKGRPCSEPQRARPELCSPHVYDEYFATFSVIQNVLCALKGQCSRLKESVYPWPVVSFQRQGTLFSRSDTLRDAMEALASALREQIRQLERLTAHISHCQCSVWSRLPSFDNHVHVTFHPDRSDAKTSNENAKQISSCTQLIWQTANHKVPYDTVRIDNQWYLKTASNIQEILVHQCFIPATTTNLILTRQAIPASHIAYLNGDSEAALELWRRSPDARDLLDRSMAHVVVERGDATMLLRMAELDLGSLNCGHDARGTNILALAIISGVEDCVDLVLDIHRQLQTSAMHGLYIPSNTAYQLLDLGLISGSRHIIEEVLGAGYARPTVVDVLKAIELGRGDLAWPFLEWLFQNNINQEDVKWLTDIARRRTSLLEDEYNTAWQRGFRSVRLSVERDVRCKNMHQLIRRLTIRGYVAGNPPTAIQSLENLVH